MSRDTGKLVAIRHWISGPCTAASAVETSSPVSPPHAPVRPTPTAPAVALPMNSRRRIAPPPSVRVNVVHTPVPTGRATGTRDGCGGRPAIGPRPVREWSGSTGGDRRGRLASRSSRRHRPYGADPTMHRPRSARPLTLLLVAFAVLAAP